MISQHGPYIAPGGLGSYDRNRSYKRMRYSKNCVLVVMCQAAIVALLLGQSGSTVESTPHFEHRTHMAGKILLRVTNRGFLGLGFDASERTAFLDSTTFAYPKGTAIIYGQPHLFVSGIVRGDTSLALGYMPGSIQSQESNNEFMTLRSISDPGAKELGVLSEENIRCVFADTIVKDWNEVVAFGGSTMRHRPLNIRIEQRSFAWKSSQIDDFILFEYAITNISLRDIQGLYIGPIVGINAGRSAEIPPRRGIGDDISGYFPNLPAKTIDTFVCARIEPARGFWFTDNDGDPDTSDWSFDELSATGVMAVVLLYPNEISKVYSFNWSQSGVDRTHEFGPRRSGTVTHPFRKFEEGLATPSSITENYYVMSSGESDYDQLFTALDHSSQGWLPPPELAEDFAIGTAGTALEAMLTVGPYDLRPGQSIHFAFALVGAEGFHTHPRNLIDKWDPFNPDKFIDNLDFSGLMRNITFARWAYDNPGFDTNRDGNRGKFQVCQRDSIITRYRLDVDSSGVFPITTLVLDTLANFTFEDTIWIEGDGVPDFRAITPPAEPQVRVSSELEKIVLQWNGLESETTPDIFTRQIDFEGYNVYLGLARRQRDMILASSYDIENYTQWYFNPGRGTVFDTSRWEVIRKPFKLDEARLIYARGSPNWHPLDHNIDNPLQYGDSVFYFAAQNWNQSNLRDTTALHKLYPDAPYPHTLILDSAFTNDTLWVDPLTGDSIFYKEGELTPDAKYFKYFEYRFIFENLLPSRPYFVAVTAFDFGSPETGLRFTETDRVATAIEALAQERVEQSLVDGLNVIVYPNPYRIDGRYREFGFEGRGREDFPDERVREVHFTNLPPTCDVNIYSLDGDLVRTIEHRKAPDDPSAMHDSWDVISRNLSPVVSGIYYWTVETPDGRTQIGKLVLIM